MDCTEQEQLEILERLEAVDPKLFSVYANESDGLQNSCFDESEVLPQRLEHINNLVLMLVGVAMAVMADAHGYDDLSSVKIMPGEVWPFIEGSGHSIFAVAAAYSLFSLLKLGIFEGIMKAETKAEIAILLAGIMEITQLQSLLTFKDFVLIMPFGAVLAMLEILMRKLEKRLLNNIH